MKKILHHSRFEPKNFGHGGERRTSQIIQFYINNGFEVQSISLNPKNHYRIKYLFKSLLLLISVYRLGNWYSLKRLLKWWKYIYQIYPSLENIFKSEAEIFAWESTMDSFSFLPYLAKKSGKKVYAFPHNIESLVKEEKSSITGKSSPFGYHEEIHAYKICDKVYCISKFDQQLLKLFNVDSILFPYKPTNELEKYLESIKNRRKTMYGNSQQLKNFLIAGTAFNPPTRIGMNTLLNWLNKFATNEFRFAVAGYGTEMFKQEVKNENIKLLGSLSQDELQNEMLRCDALLVYQIPTTGILTRVIEFNIAGIPVFINSEAAYNFLEMNDIYFYSNFESIMSFNINASNKLSNRV